MTCALQTLAENTPALSAIDCQSHNMPTVMRLLRKKRRADGADMIVLTVIVVAVLAFFGFITLHF